MRASLCTFLIAGAACLPLGGCRTDSGSGVAEWDELTGGGSGKSRPVAGGEVSEGKKPDAPSASQAKAADVPKKETDGPGATSAKEPARMPAPVAAKTSGSGADLMTPDKGGISAKRKGPGLPDSAAPGPMTKASAGAGLPAPGELAPTGAMKTGSLSLPSADVSASRAAPASIGLSAVETKPANRRTEASRISVPGGIASADAAKTGGEPISIPAIESAEKRRAAPSPVAIRTGEAPVAARSAVAAPSLKMEAEARAQGRQPSAGHRVALPSGPKPGEGTADSRALPEGVAGEDPLSRKRIPIPFRLTEWISGETSERDRRAETVRLEPGERPK